MHVTEATEIANRWVAENRTSFPGYRGAYLAGSICWLGAGDEMSPYSDIDVKLIIDDDKVAAKPGKFRYHGLLLEISVDPLSLITTPEKTLAVAAAASSIARNRIVDDPERLLQPAFDLIAAEFPRRHRVIERMDAIQHRIAMAMGQIDKQAAFHDQMMWMFPAGVTTHLILAAGLGNPTVRRRYVEVGMLLDRYGESDLLDVLLNLIGCDRVTREVAELHLAALTPIYDATASIECTTSTWTSDISADARMISIDGTRDLIERGLHRESMFWIVATFTRCLNVIAHSNDQRHFEAADTAFRSLTADLGFHSIEDIRRQAGLVLDELPAIRAVADRILERNPDVID